MRLHKGPGTLSSTLAPRCWRQSTRLVLLGQLLLFLGGIFTWGGLPAWADWVWKLELLAWDPSRGFWLVFLSRLCFPVAMLLSSVSLAGAALLPGVLLCRGAALCGTAAHIAFAASDHAFFLSLFLAGLPALVTLPPLLIQWAEGMCFSRGLLRPGAAGPVGGWAGVAAAFSLACVAALVCVLLERTAIPVLVSLV